MLFLAVIPDETIPVAVSAAFGGMILIIRTLWNEWKSERTAYRQSLAEQSLAVSNLSAAVDNILTYVKQYAPPPDGVR